MNRNKKILNVTMAAGMAAVLGTTPVIAAAQEADNAVSKEETVYVNATAEGEVKDITVSDWLKNSGSAEGDVSDVSDLEGIKNVKGDESFTQDGDKVTWSTDSSDIYYQGTSNKELPVDMKIKYYLDDQEITPDELAGKSGHLRMEVSYTNKSKKTVKVDDKDVEVYSPFVMVTGMILSSDNFSNVTIDNGKVISDGDKEMVVGVAVPGLKASLDLSDDLSDKIDIPEGFTMEADVTDCSMENTFTMAVTDLLSSLNLDESDDLDDLQDSLDELDDAAVKLVDGSKDLYDGTKELYDGTKDLKDGTSQLYDGATDLDDGAKELADGTDTLYDGTKELDDGAKTLNTGAGELYDGTSQLYSGTKTLYDGTRTLYGGASTLASSYNEFDAGVASAKSGASKLNSGAKSLQSGIAQYTSGVGSLASGVNSYTKGVDTVNSNMKEYKKGMKSLADGVNQYVAGGNQLASGVTTYVMEPFS